MQIAINNDSEGIYFRRLNVDGPMDQSKEFPGL